MFKSSFLLALATMACVSPVFSVNCPGINPVICLEFFGDNIKHFMRLKVNGFTSKVMCAPAVTHEAFSFLNKAITTYLMSHVLTLGRNDFEFIQCDNRFCQHPVSDGNYTFYLTQNPSTGGYMATPSHYTFHAGSYGETCELEASSYIKYFM